MAPGQPGGAMPGPYVPPQGPHSGPQPAAQHALVPQPVAVSLADAVQAAHGEGFNFGQAVANPAWFGRGRKCTQIPPPSYYSASSPGGGVSPTRVGLVSVRSINGTASARLRSSSEASRFGVRSQRVRRESTRDATRRR